MDNELEQYTYKMLINIRPCTKRNRYIDKYYAIKNSRENEKEKEVLYTMLIKEVEVAFKL